MLHFLQLFSIVIHRQNQQILVIPANWVKTTSFAFPKSGGDYGSIEALRLKLAIEDADLINFKEHYGPFSKFFYFPLIFIYSLHLENMVQIISQIVD